jgi:hypothetical protein
MYSPAPDYIQTDLVPTYIWRQVDFLLSRTEVVVDKESIREQVAKLIYNQLKGV